LNGKTASAGNPNESNAGVLSIGRDGRAMLNLSYSITFDRMDEQDPGNQRFHDAHRRRSRGGLCQFAENPNAAIAKLEPMLAQFADAPVLYNWLTAAYLSVGEDEAADRLAMLNYERNPNYLFAKFELCDALLQRGDLERVAKVFRQRSSISS